MSRHYNALSDHNTILNMILCVCACVHACACMRVCAHVRMYVCIYSAVHFTAALHPLHVPSTIMLPLTIRPYQPTKINRCRNKSNRCLSGCRAGSFARMPGRINDHNQFLGPVLWASAPFQLRFVLEDVAFPLTDNSDPMEAPSHQARLCVEVTPWRELSCVHIPKTSIKGVTRSILTSTFMHTVCLGNLHYLCLCIHSHGRSISGTFLSITISHAICLGYIYRLHRDFILRRVHLLDIADLLDIELGHHLRLRKIVHLCVHVCMRACVRAFVRACVCACVRTCVCACVHECVDTLRRLPSLVSRHCVTTFTTY